MPRPGAPNCLYIRGLIQNVLCFTPRWTVKGMVMAAGRFMFLLNAVFFDSSMPKGHLTLYNRLMPQVSVFDREGKWVEMSPLFYVNHSRLLSLHVTATTKTTPKEANEIFSQFQSSIGNATLTVW